MLDIWPAHNCLYCLSDLLDVSSGYFKGGLGNNFLEVSPMPVGRTPGFLLNAIRRHASSGDVMDGSSRLVHNRLAESAIE